jgi:hypothetical protein
MKTCCHKTCKIFNCRLKCIAVASCKDLFLISAFLVAVVHFSYTFGILLQLVRSCKSSCRKWLYLHNRIVLQLELRNRIDPKRTQYCHFFYISISVELVHLEKIPFSNVPVLRHLTTKREAVFSATPLRNELRNLIQFATPFYLSFGTFLCFATPVQNLCTKIFWTLLSNTF